MRELTTFHKLAYINSNQLLQFGNLQTSVRPFPQRHMHKSFDWASLYSLNESSRLIVHSCSLIHHTIWFFSTPTARVTHIWFIWTLEQTFISFAILPKPEVTISWVGEWLAQGEVRVQGTTSSTGKCLIVRGCLHGVVLPLFFTIVACFIIVRFVCIPYLIAWSLTHFLLRQFLVHRSHDILVILHFLQQVLAVIMFSVSLMFHDIVWIANAFCSQPRMLAPRLNR